MVTKNSIRKIAVSFMILLISLPFADICAQSYRGSTKWNNAVRSARERRSRSIRNQQFFDELWKPKNDKQIKNEDEEQKDESEKATQSNVGANSDSVKTKTQIGISDANQNKEKNVELVVTGDGDTKEKAVQTALRSAIEQAFGTFVSSNTQILNDELMKDEITTVSSGNIRDYKILSEYENNGKYFVSLQAVVSINKLTEFAKSKGNAAELAGNVFLQNKRMKELQISNAQKAVENVKIQMKAMLPFCFDYAIEVSEPNTVRFVDRKTGIIQEYAKIYEVPIKVIISANKNINSFNDTYLSTLKSLRAYESHFSFRQGLFYDMLDQMILGFKIVDDLGEYHLSKMKSLDKPEVEPSCIVTDKYPDIIYSGYLHLSGTSTYWASLRTQRLALKNKIFNFNDADTQINTAEYIDKWNIGLIDGLNWSSSKDGDLDYNYDAILEGKKVLPLFFPMQRIYILEAVMIYTEEELSKVKNISVVHITNDMQITPKKETTNYDAVINDGGEKIYEAKEVDTAPEFANGGEAGLLKYISQNMEYPREAELQELEGSVTVQFVIEKDGSVSHIQAIKSPDPILSEAACRVVKATSGKWNAGMKNGNYVRVKYIIPIAIQVE